MMIGITVHYSWELKGHCPPHLSYILLYFCYINITLLPHLQKSNLQCKFCVALNHGLFNANKSHVYIEPLLKLYHNFQTSFQNTCKAFVELSQFSWRAGFLPIIGKLIWKNGSRLCRLFNISLSGLWVAKL